MNKAMKYARNGALAGGAVLGLYNAIDQLFLRKDSNQEFDWWELLKNIAKGAGWGGAIGLGIGALSDYANKFEKPIDTDAALLALVSKVKLDPSDLQYVLLKEKSDWLIEIIEREFAGDLKRRPHRFGSTERGTALEENYDIDIFVPFKSAAFTSIADMFYCLLETLRQYVGENDIVEVRDQSKSIGVIFSFGGVERKIDIVPQKATKGSRTSGYLYVNNKGLFEKPSRKKTDVNLQDTIKLSEMQKRILVALKDWKKKENLPLSSHLLQYLILEAYYVNKGYVPRRFTDKIVMVLKFIHEYIETIVLSSVENTNNILTDISEGDKRVIAKACKTIIEDYEYQPNSITNLMK